MENKELTPLEAINYLIKEAVINDPYDRKCLWIIKKSLEESCALRTLNCELQKDSEYFNNERSKYKQALEIIKEKNVDVGWLISCENIEQYNNVIGTATHKPITQEQFDLLKGVLL